MSAAKKNWVDDDDEDDQRVESNVVKERLKLSENSKGQKVRTTIKYRVKEIRTKVPKRVVERRNIPRFGDAKIGEENVTITNKDFITMDHPDDNDDDNDPTLKNTLQSFAQKQQERSLIRELENDHENDSELPTDSAADSRSGSSATAGQASGSSYVPPNMRNRAGGASTATSSLQAMATANSDDNTIRVSNLTKDVTDADLMELFEPFGRVHRVYLPKVDRIDASGRTVKEPKGFAFIAYLRKEDAEAAMERLQGHGYAHLILKLEWARPNRDNANGGGNGLSSGFVSGYGTKLAQDTKERVLYASNLTGNR